jgi:hypothetical protein
MQVFYLEPIESGITDPSWATSLLKEACWVAASTDAFARRKLEIATFKSSDPKGPLYYSPWLNFRLTTCRPVDKPPVDMRPGTIVSISGKILVLDR